MWHYRRNTVKAYLKQQRGYGEAEALLKYKHPDHFNTLGASHWRGKIYGGDQIGVKLGGDVVYHGVFGTGLFQTIYRRPASILAMMLMSIEWHLLAGFTLLLSLAFAPLFFVAVRDVSDAGGAGAGGGVSGADAAAPALADAAADRVSAFPPADRAGMGTV